MTRRPEEIQTIVALLRVSTEAQERDGYSLQAQKQARERDCREFGWRCLATYEGQETGSAMSQRRIIHDLIVFVREHRPDAVWVIEQSRLTRGDELDVAMLIRELRESGTKVVTERGNVVDPTDLEGAFHFRLKALMDRREWEVIAARNKRGKDEKARRGLLVNARPAYGYTTTGEGRDKGLRVPVPAEADVVRQIFEWAAGGLSIRKIVRRLHEQGIPAPTQAGRSSGKQPERFKNGIQVWAPTTIKRMLKNPLYRGVSYRNCWIKKGSAFVFDPSNSKAIWVEDAHAAIIPQSLWEDVQRQLTQRQTKTHNDVHMLTGILVCPICGNTFRVTTSDDGRGHKNSYYFCNSKRSASNEFGERRRTASACSMRWLRLGDTDRLVWQGFLCLISSPEMVDRYLASADAEMRRQGLKAQIDNLEDSAASIDAMMARARQKLLTEILTDGEYLREREQLDTQLTGIQSRLVSKKAELRSISNEAGRQVIQNLALLKLGEKKLSRDQRSRLFHAIVSRVVPNGPELTRIDIELFVKPSTNSGEKLMTPATECVAPAPVAITLRLPVEVVASSGRKR